MGFHEDPFSNLGRLRAELFRSVRLVVDTGLHYKRWTREEAIAYMLTKTGLPETEVVGEIERYMVLPGQACAYKVGMIKILQIRDRARRELGDVYDIKGFHAVVLKNGSVPLDTLDADRRRLHRRQEEIIPGGAVMSAVWGAALDPRTGGN